MSVSLASRWLWWWSLLLLLLLLCLVESDKLASLIVIGGGRLPIDVAQNYYYYYYYFSCRRPEVGGAKNLFDLLLWVARGEAALGAHGKQVAGELVVGASWVQTPGRADRQAWLLF